MLLSSLDSIPDKSPSVNIRAVSNPEEIEENAELTVQNSDIAVNIARLIVPRSMMTADAFVLIIARMVGQPVGRGMLFFEDNVAGLYNVGVIEDYRRQGIGEVITWEILRAGRKPGGNWRVAGFEDGISAVRTNGGRDDRRIS